MIDRIDIVHVPHLAQPLAIYHIRSETAILD